MADPTIKNELKWFYFKLQSGTIHRCLEPRERCTAKVIKAHSIQNSRVLDQICRNCHVVMPKLYHPGSAPPVIKFREVGRSQASTFAGLCRKHDNDIFSPIDDSEFDQGNDQQLFLLAYRSTLRELHAVMRAAVQAQLLYQRRVKLGLSPANEPDRVGLYATERIVNAYETYLYKRMYDEAYLHQDYSALQYDILTIRHDSPTVAASALFSLGETQAPHDVPRVALNIFPCNEVSYVVFSYTAQDAPYATLYLDEILSAAGQYQLCLLSQLILQSCENFVISPKYFDRLSEERKAAISSYFLETLLINKPANNIEKLCLF